MKASIHFCIFTFSFCSIISSNVYSQSEANNWYFGLSAGITFATAPPSFLAGGQIQTPEGSASLSDNNGNLLFYSDGITVWAANHSIMPNGTGLNGSLTCSQSALFVPYPGNPDLYYIFTPPDQFSNAPFCYSLIDLTLNNGLGDVTNKNTPLFNPSTEKVTAVRHSNGVNIWVIGHGFNNSNFYAYEISPGGINQSPVISNVGTPHDTNDWNKIGIMKASPCGDKIALTVFDSAFVELFDFDNTTGIVSNAIHVGDFIVGNTWGLYGLEFSANGSKLYVSQEQPGLIVQYDLTAGSPAAIIASADTIVELTGTSKIAALQLGPDGKIYVSRFTEPFLATINFPDASGSACGFTDQTITFTSGGGAHGLPAFMSSYFCPEQSSAFVQDEFSFQIFPIPATDHITIILPANFFEPITLSMIDLFGKKVLNQTIQPGTASARIDLSMYSSAVYFITIDSGKNKYFKKLVKQSK